MPIEELIKGTNAYKIIEGEKRNDALCHAYLVLSEDGECLREYLKVFAKLIMSDGGDDGRRAERLIDKEAYADCTFYPSGKDRILTADIDELVAESFIKPLENKLRLFVLCGAEDINASAQNKLLKTLEEPPENVIILMGATNEYSLLPTIRSRVEKLEIPLFNKERLKSAFRSEYKDEEKLDAAIAVGGGKASAVIKAYESGEGESVSALCKDILKNLKSSRDVVKFVDKINKDNISEFLTAMKEEVGGLLKEAVKNGKKEACGFAVGALINIEDMLDKKRRATFYNANVQMTVDGILFSIAEEKYRWQKL
ncbi:MAG: hypothetical protein J5836_01470 [Clostridia bacterium]|nr:hypothetical protein [Clostridia bacterium]